MTTTTSSPSSSTATTPPGPIQYVTNPSLEGGSQTGWRGTYSAASLTSVVQVPGGSFDGQWALQIANGGAKTAAVGVSNASPMWVDGTLNPSIAGTTYTASVWVRGAAKTKVKLRLQQCAAAGKSCRATVVSPVVTLKASTWTHLSLPITTAANGQSIAFTVMSPSLAPRASFLADEFSLTSPGV